MTELEDGTPFLPDRILREPAAAIRADPADGFSGHSGLHRADTVSASLSGADRHCTLGNRRWSEGCCISPLLTLEDIAHSFTDGCSP